MTELEFFTAASSTHQSCESLGETFTSYCCFEVEWEELRVMVPICEHSIEMQREIRIYITRPVRVPEETDLAMRHGRLRTPWICPGGCTQCYQIYTPFPWKQKIRVADRAYSLAAGQ
ncbi:hypothetical protein Nepgr_032336 [Nepenthes gracilis]|uniref:Uncharacterized protein n=1 Tax=Nepenthes gracilis TaxID=150966 RepID=A0AAD3Y5Y9_NEPGR|nr:hypothetical protein Nepgr_032336 [Nepenthes gracilis]